MRFLAKILYGIGVTAIAAVVTVIFVIVSFFAWLGDVGKNEDPNEPHDYYGPLG